MVAPVVQDKAVAKSTKPLPRAIQLVMAISSLLEPSTTASMKTIGEHGVDRFHAWMKLVFLPSMVIAAAALPTYHLLHDHYDEVISGAGGFGFVFLVDLQLPGVYLAVVLAADGHLSLFAPQTPYAACEALQKVGSKGMFITVILTSLGANMLYALMHERAWLLLVTCANLLGLLVASTIAFWLWLFRTYGRDGGGERREMNSSCGEAVIEGLAYLCSRVLYEYAARFLADAEADAGMQQLDSDSSSLE